MKFAALDFETANYTDPSICAAGVAVFEDGRLQESLYWLIRPPKGHGWFREDFTAIHGLTWFDVCDAPEFPAIAPELLLRLTAADLVIAHNAQFDLRKLCGTLEHFGLPCPGFDVLCTYRTAQRVWPELPSHTLGALAEYIGHQFDHHHAQADAEAAGRVLLALMQHAKVQTPVELARSAGMELAHMGEGATGSS